MSLESETRHFSLYSTHETVPALDSLRGFRPRIYLRGNGLDPTA